MKAKVVSIDGSAGKEIKLPSHFDEQLRTDLIARAVISAQANRRQDYGSDTRAGKRSSAKYKGTRKGWGHSYGYGQARIPRLMISGGRAVGRAMIAPQTVGGRRAHPPKVETVRGEKINRKERTKAIRSAIAATGDQNVVSARGHKFEASLPLVVENKLEGLKKLKEVKQAFKSLGINNDLERASKKKIRAGKGKLRGRKYKKKVGPLIVIGNDKGIVKASKNLPGVQVTRVEQLNAELLAPGSAPGRLTLWTQNAIEKLAKLYGE